MQMYFASCFFNVLLLLIAETGCNFWALLASGKQFPLKGFIIAPGKILNANCINQLGEAYSHLSKVGGVEIQVEVGNLILPSPPPPPPPHPHPRA